MTFSLIPLLFNPVYRTNSFLPSDNIREGKRLFHTYNIVLKNCVHFYRSYYIGRFFSSGQDPDRGRETWSQRRMFISFLFMIYLMNHNMERMCLLLSKKLAKWLLLALCVQLNSFAGAAAYAENISPVHDAQHATVTGETYSGPVSGTHVFDIGHWNISNQGTNPVETTRGINEALRWAHENGITDVSLPSGTYLISKDDHIEMVSNITLTLDEQTVLRKETNGYTSYKLMHIGPGVSNVTLRGGTYEGDKDTHNYSASGTHEGGYGIVLSGAVNVTIDGIRAVQFTGDGMSIGRMGRLIQDLYAKHFESGGVDAQGQLVHDPTQSRVTYLPLTHPYFDMQRTFQFIHQRNLPQGAKSYTAYFYRADGSFISKVDTADTHTPVDWSVTSIPADAAYMHAVFAMPTIPSNLYIEFWMQGVSKNILVTDSEFAHNRRQGITVGGAQDVIIQNSTFHHMRGIAPESGIDLEAGYHLNNNVHILNNDFYDNRRYDLILYDGKNAFVEGNRFGSKGAIGLAISEPFKFATIRNNHFDGSQIYAYNHATFDGNRMNDGLAAFLGSELVVKNMEFTDTLVNLASSTPFGIEVADITVYNTKKLHTNFGVNKNPLQLDRVTIIGEAALDSLTGNATDGSIFNDLQILGFNRTQLPRGTYNNCVFEVTENETKYGSFEINNSGHYVFNNCTFTSSYKGFNINGFHGTPDSVTIENSTFHINTDYSSLVATSGKQITLRNNVFNALSMKRANLEIIRIGDYWKRNDPTLIGNVVIEGNTVNSNLAGPGISTIYAGTGADPYSITNNTLNQAKLALKGNDITENNVEQ